jgi:hypothetical protein
MLACMSEIVNEWGQLEGRVLNNAFSGRMEYEGIVEPLRLRRMEDPGTVTSSLAW